MRRIRLRMHAPPLTGLIAAIDEAFLLPEYLYTQPLTVSGTNWWTELRGGAAYSQGRNII
jgi:hypothetical protein